MEFILLAGALLGSSLLISLLVRLVAKLRSRRIVAAPGSLGVPEAGD
jgi:hypothetical protein